MARTKKAAVVEDELDELEELDEVEEAPKTKKAGKKAAPAEEAKPAKKSRKAAADDDEESSAYGAAWLADYVNEQTDKNYTAANIRVLLRKLAKDGTLDREVGEDRSRYAFTGPSDPIVKAVLKHVKEGALEKERAERINNVKEKAAAKKASSKKAVVEEDEDEDEDEVETPAPKKRATRRR